MKIYQLALLISVALLPSHDLLAESAKIKMSDTVKAPVAASVPAAENLQLVVPVKQSGEADSGAIAGPGTAATVRLPVVPRDSVVSKLGANLKILSFSWGDEVCARSCPELTRTTGFDLPTCDLEFRVTNTGDVASGNFSVTLLRTTISGTDTPLQINASGIYTLAAHETKTFKISPGSLGVYKVGRLFTLKVDSLNEIAETNENDNSATFLPQ